MIGWKKIAALFAFSTSAGLLVAACNGGVKETGDTPQAEDESVTLDTPATPELTPLRWVGPGFARRQCENSCLDSFNRCMRRPGSNAGCRFDRGRCLNRCSRF